MNRRRFFHWCSLLLSGLAVAFVAIPGVAFLIDPLSSGGKNKKPHRLTKLADLDVGVPRKLVIIDQRTDAWTRYPEGPVGAVWLVRQQDDSVAAFSTICPHLGCPVDFVASDRQFYCPCHEASYSADGAIISGPQQRGLDGLDVRVEQHDGEAWVSVVFQKFEVGISGKVALG